MKSGVLMFIASYTTYIPTIPATKTNSTKEKDFRPKTDIFAEKKSTPEKTEIPQELNKTISSYNLYNKEKNKNLDLYEKIKTLQNAQTAYKETTQPFSSMRKPKAPQQNSFSTLSLTLPKEAKTAQEQLLKIKMVNTYIQNDNYYKVTAA